jgi:hypothetical protein
VTEREERIARNEVLFRDLNERLKEIGATIALQEPEALELFCECGQSDCTEKLTLSASEYEYVRARPERFFVAAGHDAPEVEEVVDQRGPYWIVEKHEEEAQIARERDPRS